MKLNLGGGDGGGGFMMVMRQSSELEMKGGREKAGETKEHKEKAETDHYGNGMSHQPTG